MKKILGWSIVVFCSLFLFLILLACINFLADPEMRFHGQSVYEALISYLIISVAFVFFLRFGRSLIKNNSIVTIPYTQTLSLHPSGVTSYTDYRNVMLSLTLRSPAYQIILLAAFLLVFFFLLGDHVHSYWAVISVVFIVFFSFKTWQRIKKTYESTKLFHSETEYHITTASLQIKGEDVDSTTKWSYYIRTKETKHFILLYPSKQLAVLINKKFFSSEDLIAFKQFLKSLPIPHN
ncbi:MAG: YcxB family protein [Cytophagaceae bacterium]|nr:YcxB family protein [Cytophagaceae bacterium]